MTSPWPRPLLTSHPVGFDSHVNPSDLYGSSVRTMVLVVLRLDSGWTVGSDWSIRMLLPVCFPPLLLLLLLLLFLETLFCLQPEDLDQPARVYHLRPNLCQLAKVCVCADVCEESPLVACWWICAGLSLQTSLRLLVEFNLSLVSWVSPRSSPPAAVGLNTTTCCSDYSL